ncbi:MAG: beta-galactosidase [Mangrovibacterium sp.]
MLKILSLFCTLLLVQNLQAQPQNFFPKEKLMSVGVYYYPEHWDSSQWERDFTNIQSQGFEFIHMAEFAWAQLEPEEGTFNFEWLDHVVALAEKHELKVILGTPTPCPPVWLAKKHPDIYIQGADYIRKEHGTRANMSLSNPTVLQYTKRIVEEMAKHFGHNSNVIGWQIDNEPEAKEDYSEAAQQAFRTWLHAKYSTIEQLNTAWGTQFWSQLYTDFNQINIPNAHNVGWWGINPIALLDFKRFTADAQANFIDFQANLIKQYTNGDQYITTNYVAKGGNTDPRRVRKLDFASFTAYPNYGSSNLGELGFRLGDPSVLLYASDYYRSINGVNGVMELQPGQVNWANHNSLLLPGAVRMWLYHCFAGGSSFACTYRYRQVLYGAEQYHQGVLTTDGLNLTQGGKEYVQVIQEMKNLREACRLDAQMPKAIAQRKSAILWNFDNLWNLEQQKQTFQWDTWAHMQRYQKILHSFGAPVDIIDESVNFNAYKFLVVPAYEMVDEQLVQRWKDFVMQGGQLIITSRTGAKDRNAHLWESNLSGIMNDLIGAKVEQFDMLPAGQTGKLLYEGEKYEWSTWGDLLEVFDATTIGTYADQFYMGKSSIVTRSIGKGKVWYIGVISTDGELEKKVMRSIYTENKVMTESYPEGVFVAYRDGFMIAVNYSSQEFHLSHHGRYIIGDEILESADVAIWQAD